MDVPEYIESFGPKGIQVSIRKLPGEDRFTISIGAETINAMSYRALGDGVAELLYYLATHHARMVANPELVAVLEKMLQGYNMPHASSAGIHHVLAHHAQEAHDTLSSYHAQIRHARTRRAQADQEDQELADRSRIGRKGFVSPLARG